MTLPPQLHHAMLADLRSGERILWSGQPDPVSAMAGKTLQGLFGLVFMLIPIGTINGAWAKGDVVSAAMGMLFAGVGLITASGFLTTYVEAKGAAFFITDQRLVEVRRHGRVLRSLSLAAVRQVERIERRGRLTLRIPTALVSDGDGGNKVEYLEMHGLRDGEAAYRLLTSHA